MNDETRKWLKWGGIGLLVLVLALFSGYFWLGLVLAIGGWAMSAATSAARGVGGLAKRMTEIEIDVRYRKDGNGGRPPRFEDVGGVRLVTKSTDDYVYERGRVPLRRRHQFERYEFIVMDGFYEKDS